MAVRRVEMGTFANGTVFMYLDIDDAKDRVTAVSYTNPTPYGAYLEIKSGGVWVTYPLAANTATEVALSPPEQPAWSLVESFRMGYPAPIA